MSNESEIPKQYEIEWERVATKGKRRIPRDILDQMDDAVQGLATTPRPEGISALTGPWKGHYRMKITQGYRVIYTVDDKARKVTIVLLGSRENLYDG